MQKRLPCFLTVTIASLVLLSACVSQEGQSDMAGLTQFATRYAAAWSNGDPVAFASFYAENGSFRINDGEASVGREAIAETAASFMAAFPDMLVRLIEVRQTDEYVEFHWHWTGTNTGPGGTGNAVDLKGYEQWTLSEEGLILETLGNMDDAEYQRQLHADSTASESIIDKQIHGCELALKHYQAKVGDDAEPTPWPLTEEEKIYSTLCAGITKSVLTSLDAYGRAELEAEGVCLPDSTKDFDLTLLLPVVLEKMKSRLTQPSSNETYDAMFLVTTATLDALQDSYTCKRADVIE